LFASFSGQTSGRADESMQEKKSRKARAFAAFQVVNLMQRYLNGRTKIVAGSSAT